MAILATATVIMNKTAKRLATPEKIVKCLQYVHCTTNSIDWVMIVSIVSDAFTRDLFENQMNVSICKDLEQNTKDL